MEYSFITDVCISLYYILLKLMYIFPLDTEGNVQQHCIYSDSAEKVIVSLMLENTHPEP